MGRWSISGFFRAALVWMKVASATSVNQNALVVAIVSMMGDGLIDIFSEPIADANKASSFLSGIRSGRVLNCLDVMFLVSVSVASDSVTEIIKFDFYDETFIEVATETMDLQWF